ncbi:MAG: HAD-IIIC family phosphatase, partial [Acidobacteria bacterium]|nr:HAD-IIIC family phosphatase [Acidobacteriota bacterium]
AVKMELLAGFPYRQAHAEVIAHLLVDALYPPPPRKGLIIDLDNTLWSGILGEVGPANVCWDLTRRAQVHAIFQQLLASLAETGVLIGVASKNDPDLVAEALRRPDLLIRKDLLFPVEVNWGPKSASVTRILRAWNIAADSVVFVDDSAMELSEVAVTHPGMECLQFTAANPDNVWKLLWRLRDLFGKQAIREEDGLRSASIRAAAALEKAADGELSGEFLEQMRATITIDFRKDPDDARALELVNKTNQFNVNGRRFTEASWKAWLQEPSTFLMRVSYQDKFGPLGQIAVVFGTTGANGIHLDAWVMSCRAFSRRIEHHMLDSLLARHEAGEVVVAFRRTERNGPARDFLSRFGELTEEGSFRISREGFQSACGLLPHEVQIVGQRDGSGT